MRLLAAALLALAAVHVDAAAKKTAAKKQDPGSTIEDVDEDKIDEILDESEQFLVIFFYDVKSKCPGCASALQVMEEIDDDLEADGLIEVVKTDDKHVMRRYAVHALPAVVYLRKDKPILYDGELVDADAILRWLRAHDEVAVWELDDDEFEDRTESADPDEGALDWFVMFYDSSEEDCTAQRAMFEAVGHRLRGLVNCAAVDVDEADDVAQRFKIDDNDDCPEYILMHRGKMYEYKAPAVDVTSLTQFALFRYKEHRGHRVPDPPTDLEEFVEELKEGVVDWVSDHSGAFTGVVAVGALGAMLYGGVLAFKAYKARAKEE